MKHALPYALSFMTAALVAGCGGKSTATVGNVAGGGASASPIPAGIHGCHFVADGFAYGEHRCDIVVGPDLRIEKLSGMETFAGTLAPTAAGVRLTAAMACGEMDTACRESFSVDLHKTDGGWSGAVVPDDANSDWWLSGATLEVNDAAGYGGEPYGSAWEPVGD